jgi:LruC domain-containing protein
MNDLVLRYRTTRVEDVLNKVKDLAITVQIQARGGSFVSGFGVELPGLPLVPDNVESATMAINGGAAEPVPPEAGQTNLTWIFFDSGHMHARNVAGFSYFNTEAGQPGPQPVPEFTLRVTFTNAVRMDSGMLLTPYNPFIFRANQRGKEVHLPNYPPTKLADPALFGTGDDDSNVSDRRYYLSKHEAGKEGLPWALNIPEKWATHPLETVPISMAYGNFESWVQTGMTWGLGKDWYNNPVSTPVRTFPYGHLLD